MTSTVGYTNDRNFYLSALDYGNGDKVQYTYDSMGRVTTAAYEDGETVKYTYDNSGTLATVKDSFSGTSTTYGYDFIGRLSAYKEKDADIDMTMTYQYNSENGLVAYVRDVYNGHARGTYYTYDSDNRLTKYQHARGFRSYTYDGFNRISSYETSFKSTNGTIYTPLQTEIAYVSPSESSTSNQVESIRQTGLDFTTTYSYTYDSNGNILSVSDGTDTTSYVYDSANQLIRENNQEGGFTYTWEYDNAGNILNRKEYAYTTGELGEVLNTVTYTYGDSDWGDLLTAYNGNAITYDAIGNPLSDGTWDYTWQHGRQLASMTDGETTWSYTYNADGLRTKRTDGTNTYTYAYYGGVLRYMEKNGTPYYFTTAPDGTPMGIVEGDVPYYFVTNLQGDVVGIVRHNGQRVVTYTYDAWGNVLSITGIMASTLGKINPIRYRGYVYDAETGLYYLQSRYYNPETGRFINADGYVSTGQGILGNNMFAYCGNSAISNKDESGSRYMLIDVTTIGSFRDVTDEVNAALFEARECAETISKYLNNSNDIMQADSIVQGRLMTYGIFISWVYHNKKWDIKREKPWVDTIGTPFPGNGTRVLYNGIIMTPEDIGNFTYGYLGKAFNYTLTELYGGSYVAAGFPTKGADIENEAKDWAYITLGYLWDEIN